MIALLQEIARATERNHPAVALLALLVDAPAEGVAEMRRTVAGEVVATTCDGAPARHVQVAEIVQEKAKRLRASTSLARARAGRTCSCPRAC